VFIDGKYINAPYTVKRKGLAVYINGIQVTKEMKIEPEQDPYAINARCGYPPNLTDSSSLHDLRKTINEELGIPYYHANANYFYKHYKYEDALDSIEAYYKNAPNILSVGAKNACFFLETKKGETLRLVSTPGRGEAVSKQWGPNGHGATPLRKLKEKAEQELDKNVEFFKKRLNEYNEIFLFFTDFENFNQYDDFDVYDFDQVTKIVDIIIANGPDSEKQDSLKQFIKKENSAKLFLENFQTTPQFEKRLELLKTYLEERNKPYKGFIYLRDTLTTGEAIIDKESYNLNSEKSTTAYFSPTKNDIEHLLITTKNI
jgi:hypothetical protein